MIAMVLLVLLTALALVASVIATRDTRSRAEAIAATGLVFVALTVGPVYLLGLAGVLTRPALALTSALLSGALIARHAAQHGDSVLAAAGRRLAHLAYAPIAGVLEAAKHRSLVAVVATTAILAFPYLLVSAYLAPPYADYDALWYHEPIVAFTIQNHGFAKVELPSNLQVVNGVPRLCEMTQLWFALWAGRRLVDVANVVTMPILAASMFALAHRYTRDVIASLAWASALILMPAFLRLVQSTMVDPESAALLLAAAYFVTHPVLDRARASYAALALGLAVAAKIWFVVPVGLFTVILVGRLVAMRRFRHAAFAVLPVLVMVAVTYGRNWVLFANPFWPMLRYENEALGIHWKGEIAASPSNPLSFDDPFRVFYENMLARPYTATGKHHAWQIDDYGFAWSWIVLPLGALSATLAVARWLSCEIGARAGFPPREDAKMRSRSAAALAIVAAVSLYLSPARHIARYHVASAGMLAACVCWLFPRRAKERRGGARLAEQVGVIAALGSVLMMYWAPRKLPWAFLHEPAELVRRAKTEAPRSAIVEQTAVAREAEIGKDAVVAFEHVNLLALLWNDRYSNRVVWLSSLRPLEEAERVGATWIYSRDGGTLHLSLTQSPSWERVGPLEREPVVGTIWRRRP